MDILSIIEHIRSDSSKNFKVKAISEQKGNALFLKVLEMTYSPFIRFGIKKAPLVSVFNGSLSLEDALSVIEKISNREVTGHAALNLLSETLSNLNERDAQVLSLIIEKSLKMNCEVSSINKAIGNNFIKETAYMGAVSFSRKKVDELVAKYPYLYSQLKVDGRYANILSEDESVFAESRQGLPNHFGTSFDFLSGIKYDNEPVVFNGEIIIKGMNRYTSNGVVSSIVSIGNKILEGENIDKELKKFKKEHGFEYDESLNMLEFVVWDFIPQSIYVSKNNWEKPYSERLEFLKEVISKVNGSISIVETRIVNTVQEAMEHFLEARSRGEEGTILKADEQWKDGKPTYQIKFKHEFSVELMITSGSFGEAGTKNESVISTIHTQSQDGLLKVSPSNMSEEKMKFVTDNLDSLIGTIVTVKCNGLSQDRDGNYSLLHPVVESFRDDKSIANSLEEIKDIDSGVSEIAK